MPVVECGRRSPNFSEFRLSFDAPLPNFLGTAHPLLIVPAPYRTPIVPRFVDVTWKPTCARISLSPSIPAPKAALAEHAPGNMIGVANKILGRHLPVARNNRAAWRPQQLDSTGTSAQASMSGPMSPDSRQGWSLDPAPEDEPPVAVQLRNGRNPQRLRVKILSVASSSAGTPFSWRPMPNAQP